MQMRMAIVLAIVIAGASAQDLVVEVCDPSRPEHAGKVTFDKPPIVFEGEQVASLDDLRAKLRAAADPKATPDEKHPIVFGDVRPSTRTLVIACDAAPRFSWVQLVMQYAGVRSLRSLRDEVSKSPMIRRFEIRRRGHDRGIPIAVASTLPSRGPAAHLSLTIDPADEAFPPHTRPVIIESRSDEALGAIAGFAWHSTRPGHYSLQLQPPTALMRTREYLRMVKKTWPRARGRIRFDLAVPCAAGLEMLEALHDTGYVDPWIELVHSVYEKRLHVADLKPRAGLKDLIESDVAPVDAGAEDVQRRAWPGQVIRMYASPFPRRAHPRRNLRQMGGGGRTEQAAERGIAWLLKHQRTDGAWNGTDGEADLETTMLATSALLAGNFIAHAEHAVATERAIDWVIARQMKTGEFTNVQHVHRDRIQSLGARVLAEAYAMTAEPRFRDPALKALRFLFAARFSNKGWGRRGQDTLVTADVLATLCVGRELSLRVSGNLIESARKHLATTEAGDPTVAAASLFARILAGEDPKSEDLADLLARAQAPAASGDEELDLRLAYYRAHALHQVSRRPWSRYLRRDRVAVLEGQVIALGGDHAGSWLPEHAGEPGRSRAYATALGVLCNQVFYRYERKFPDRK